MSTQRVSYRRLLGLFRLGGAAFGFEAGFGGGGAACGLGAGGGAACGLGAGDGCTAGVSRCAGGVSCCIGLGFFTRGAAGAWRGRLVAAVRAAARAVARA